MRYCPPFEIPYFPGIPIPDHMEIQGLIFSYRDAQVTMGVILFLTELCAGVRFALPSLRLSFPLLSIFHSSGLNVLCWIIALNFDQRKLVHRRICFTSFENWWKLSIFHIIRFWFQFMDGSRSVVHRNGAVTAGNTLLLNLAFGISPKGWNLTKNC